MNTIILISNKSKNKKLPASFTCELRIKNLNKIYMELNRILKIHLIKLNIPEIQCQITIRKVKIIKVEIDLNIFNSLNLGKALN